MLFVFYGKNAAPRGLNERQEISPSLVNTHGAAFCQRHAKTGSGPLFAAPRGADVVPDGGERPSVAGVHQPSVDSIAQVNGRELRIQAAQVAQRREAIAEILAGQGETGERLGRRRLQRLLGEVGGVHRQVHMGVDESGADRTLGQADQLRPCGRLTDAPISTITPSRTAISAHPASAPTRRRTLPRTPTPTQLRNP